MFNTTYGQQLYFFVSKFSFFCKMISKKLTLRFLSSYSADFFHSQNGYVVFDAKYIILRLYDLEYRVETKINN